MLNISLNFHWFGFLRSLKFKIVTLHLEPGVSWNSFYRTHLIEKMLKILFKYNSIPIFTGLLSDRSKKNVSTQMHPLNEKKTFASRSSSKMKLFRSTENTLFVFWNESYSNRSKLRFLKTVKVGSKTSSRQLHPLFEKPYILI